MLKGSRTEPMDREKISLYYCYDIECRTKGWADCYVKLVKIFLIFKHLFMTNIVS